MSRVLTLGGFMLLVILGVIAVLLPPPAEYDGAAEVAAGHSALEADDLGVALVHYQRGLTVIPRDAAAQLGAAIVRALRADILPEDSGFGADVSRLTADVMSVNELRWLALVLWTGTFAAAGVWAVRRPDARLRIVTVSLCVVTVIVLAALVMRQAYEMTTPTAVITAFEATGYAAPVEGAPVLFTLYSAAEGRVLARREGWVRLGLADGREAWVKQEVMSDES